jgi:hypothetical protein
MEGFRTGPCCGATGTDRALVRQRGLRLGETPARGRFMPLSGRSGGGRGKSGTPFPRPIARSRSQYEVSCRMLTGHIGRGQTKQAPRKEERPMRLLMRNAAHLPPTTEVGIIE